MLSKAKLFCQPVRSLFVAARYASNAPLPITKPPADDGVVGPQPIDPKTGEGRSFGYWNYQVEMNAFAHRIGHSAEKLPSLMTALTSANFLNLFQSPETVNKCNNRMAVLGRTLVFMFTQEYLYTKYPNIPGEAVTDVSSLLASDNYLKAVAERLGVADIIRTPVKVNTAKLTVETTTTLSTALLAVVAAVYFDQGGPAARLMAHNFVISELGDADISDMIKLEHPKMILAQVLKHEGKRPPESRLLEESGRRTHFPTFVVGVFSDKKLLGEGAGTSLRRAEKEACRTALLQHYMKEVKDAPLPFFDRDYKSEAEIQIFVNSEEKLDTTQ